jgi:hypothetical protein
VSDFLKVKNLDQFQQYKDGRPIHWIKLHLSLLDDYTFNRLPETAQIHLIKIWMYAAKNKGRIENDPKWIQRRIEADSKIDLEQLVRAGFLIPYETVRDGTKSYLEERREEERREEGDKTPDCPHQKIIDLYHEILPERPTVVRELWSSSESAARLRARWREHPRHQDLDFWRGYFNSVRGNDWRMGRDKWAGVDLHWLVRPNNFQKVVQDWVNAA